MPLGIFEQLVNVVWVFNPRIHLKGLKSIHMYKWWIKWINFALCVFITILFISWTKKIASRFQIKGLSRFGKLNNLCKSLASWDMNALEWPWKCDFAGQNGQQCHGCSAVWVGIGAWVFLLSCEIRKFPEAVLRVQIPLVKQNEFKMNCGKCSVLPVILKYFFLANFFKY